MTEAFLFVETVTEVAPRSSKGRLGRTIGTIITRSVVVKTPSKIGSGVILGETIITSLFLVSDCTRVSILLSRGKKMAAFVGMRDSKNNLAKLEPAEIHRKGDADSVFGGLARELALHDITESGPRAIGDALFVSNAQHGVAHIRLASMRYHNRVGELFEDNWNIDPTAPRGIMGSAVWDQQGGLKGLALAAMVPPPAHFLEAATTVLSPKQKRETNTGRAQLAGPYVYAAPANKVLDFMETK